MCKHCGNPLTPTHDSRGRARNFCDKRCIALWREAQRRATPKPAPEMILCGCGCGTEMTAMNWWRPRKYVLGHNGRKPTVLVACIECGTKYPGRRRGNRFCSRACSSHSRINDSHLLRSGASYRHWRLACLARDDNRCRMCGGTAHLHVHHVEEFAKNKTLRYEVENGLTVCAGCHGFIHGRRLTRENFAPAQLLLALG